MRVLCHQRFFYQVEYNYVSVLNYFNPLLVQFKSLLHGQEGCVFFSGHLNVSTYQYI
jgi:hypothetical protein